MARLTGYERVKRFREKRSLEREAWYLDGVRSPGWQRNLNGHQRAAWKRWLIYYRRRRALRDAGCGLSPGEGLFGVERQKERIIWRWSVLGPI